MKGLYAVGLFLISILFDIAIYGLILRLSLQFSRVSMHNPVSQAVAKLTNFAVLPLRKILPTSRVIDTASLTLLTGVLFLKMLILPLFYTSTILPIVYLILFTLIGLIIYPCKFFFFAILIRVVLSWISPGFNNPVVQALYPITEPLLRVGRKIIPDISGFDFSP